MLKRLYVHNFRCLENFDLTLGDKRSVLLLGRNGTGKTTIGRAIEILQAIARGTNRVGDLIKLPDITLNRTEVPTRFEIEVVLEEQLYSFAVAFELPSMFRELRVLEERLAVDGTVIYERNLAQVRLARAGQSAEAAFRLDWHVVALPIVQEQSSNDPLFTFRQWLANTLVLRPVPSTMSGTSDRDTLHPDAELKNLGAWFAGLIGEAPDAYTKITEYLRDVMPDFKEIRNVRTGKEERSLAIRFQVNQETIEFSLEDLSDGERCFLIYALVIAANASHGPLLCFWDEPDNFLAPNEIGSSIMALRRAFRDRGQLVVTSHNPEAIRRFSDENSFMLFRNSHLEPAVIRSVEDVRASSEAKGDFMDALVRGDVSG